MASNLDEYFFPVPGSKQEENIVIFARRHWVSFLGDIVVALFLLIVPIVVLILAYRFLPNFFQGKVLNFLVIFGSVYYLMIITFIFNAWISYYYDIYILTKDLIVDITQSGFINRKISQLSLLRVQDVSSKIEGLFPTLFAYGDVLVETAGEKAENFLLKAIPNPQQFSAKVLEMHDLLIERESRQSQVSEGEGTFTAPKPAILPTETISEIPPNCLPKEKSEEGEVSKDDLTKGGQVQL